MKNNLFLILILLSISCASEAAKVLINIWDGAEFMVVRKLYYSGKLANLKSLGGLGELSAVTRCFNTGEPPKLKCMAGVSRDSHATMLTSLYADKHQVYSNHNFKPIPNGLTIYEQLREAVPDIKIAQIGKCHMFGIETLGNAIGDMDVFEDCKGADKYIYPRDGASRVVKRINQWKNESNFLIVVNFPWPDLKGHMFGLQSQKYRDSIVANDQYLGDMLSVMPNDGKVFVIGDHGFGNLNLETGEALPNAHGTHTPTTLFVERGIKEPGNWFMNQLAPMWLRLFYSE